MTQKSKENLDKIFELVKNHFYLDSKSLRKFEHRLYEPFIDPIFEGHLNEDFRKRVPITTYETKRSVDKGWKEFKVIFKSFYESHNINYRDFVEGLVTVGKNRVKISKQLVSFYEENNYVGLCLRNSTYEQKREYITAQYNYCCDLKLPKKTELELVLSLNFADWFLCSSSEKWGSCLNLESQHSEAFWTGLPGTIVDKNRSFLYLTDKSKKTYYDIETDSFIHRSWILLDEKDKLNIVRFFPSPLIGPRATEKIMGIGNWSFIEKEIFEGKYEIEYLTFGSGDSCFIYNDNCYLFFEGNKMKISSGSGGFIAIGNDGFEIEDGIFDYGSGLENLITINKDLSEFVNYNSHNCTACGERISPDESLEYNGDYYCEYCFNQHFFYCDCCSETHSLDDMCSDPYGDPICVTCFKENYYVCDECSSVIDKEEIYEGNKYDLLCQDCFFDRYVFCEKCNETIENNKAKYVNDLPYCEKCAEKKEIA